MKQARKRKIFSSFAANFFAVNQAKYSTFVCPPPLKVMSSSPRTSSSSASSSPNGSTGSNESEGNNGSNSKAKISAEVARSQSRNLERTPAGKAYARARAEAAEEITQIRALFEEALASAPTGTYHPVDIDRVRTDDWTILRYLQRTGSSSSPPSEEKNQKDQKVKEGFKLLKAALKWKASSGIHDASDEDFPREFYLLNALEVVGRNAEGQLVLWTTSKYSREFDLIREPIKQFMLHEIEYMDRLGGPCGLVIVSDARHVGLFNVDVDMTRYMQDIVARYYPGSIRLTVVTNLSMLLDPIYKIIVAFLDDELRATLKVVKKGSLAEVVEPKMIPEDFPGGRRKKRYLRVPSKRSFSEYESIKEVLTEEQMEHYRGLLKSMDIK